MVSYKALNTATGIPIIASKEYIAASQYIFAVSHKEALCIKTNDCTFAA
jgi:hypothetical protein